MRPNSKPEIMKTVPGMEEERCVGILAVVSLSIKYSIHRLGVLTGTFQEL
jgi:hypothetical protein